MRFYDRLVNLVSGLGTAKDKASSSSFYFSEMSQAQLDAAYRSDWIARKIIDVPPFDETREWRDWQADKPQIEALEGEERRLDIQTKVAKARRTARLYGGAALLIGVGDRDPTQELDPERIGRAGLKYVHVLNRNELTVNEIEQDPESSFFGEPKSYALAAGNKFSVNIHPSRVIRFIGAEVLDRNLAQLGWGDSILQSVNDAVQNAGIASSAIAALLQEAKVDIIKVPGFMESVGNDEYRQKIIQRFSLANTSKSMVNAVLLDSEEEWDQKQISFAQLPEVLNTYLQIASGAADIPATRLLGQTPGGLQSSGQSDIRNYYDRISADQNLSLRPALSRLDEILIRSALGSRPPDVHYTWAPLWQVSETERADIGLKKAQMTKAYAEIGLMPDEALGKGVQNMLIEDGTYPGLDGALEEFGTDQEDDEPVETIAPAGE